MRCTVASCGGAAGLRAAVLGRALCVGVLGGVNSGLPRVPCRTRCALLLLSLSSCTTSYEVLKHLRSEMNPTILRTLERLRGYEMEIEEHHGYRAL